MAHTPSPEQIRALRAENPKARARDLSPRRRIDEALGPMNLIPMGYRMPVNGDTILGQADGEIRNCSIIPAVQIMQ